MTTPRPEELPAGNQGPRRPFLSDQHVELFLMVIGVTIALGHIYANLFGTLSAIRMAALHYGGFALLCSLLTPMKGRREERGPLMLLADIAIGISALASAVYLILREDSFYASGMEFIWLDWLFSAIAILTTIELVRRTTGWTFPIIIVVCLTYVVIWGSWVDGVLYFAGLSWETLLYRNYFGGEGMFGPIARISYTYVFLFILFGAFLLRSGAADFIVDLSRAAAGKLVGGPGLVAVIASAITGTVTGSAIANTASTGVITIPTMKRAGFSSTFAGAVEAASSTGGQIMPPIMGAGAFIMASYTQIPYMEIAAVAALPAILYFASVAFWVRIEAKRLNLAPLPEAGPPLRKTLRESGITFIIPMFVVVALLVSGTTPTYAAGMGIISVVLSSWLTSRKMRARDIVDALALGSRNMATTAILLIAVGYIVNSFGTTGVGTTISLMIGDWAGGSIALTIGLIALASLVLGMGLPVTASYVVVATLSAPALRDLIVQNDLVQMIAAGDVPTQIKAMVMLVAPERAQVLGEPMSAVAARELLSLLPSDQLSYTIRQSVDPAVLATALLGAHMIIFWLSQDSNITPPVCLCAFTAAAIASSDPMRTGFMAWKIAKGLYIVPFLFAYTPILSGDPLLAMKVFFAALFGIYGIVGAIAGHLEDRVSLVGRLTLACAGTAALWPHGEILIDIIAIAIIIILFVLSTRRSKRTAQEA